MLRGKSQRRKPEDVKESRQVQSDFPEAAVGIHSFVRCKYSLMSSMKLGLKDPCPHAAYILMVTRGSQKRWQNTLEGDKCYRGKEAALGGQGRRWSVYVWDSNSDQGRMSWEGDKNLKAVKERARQTSNVLGRGVARANRASRNSRQARAVAAEEGQRMRPQAYNADKSCCRWFAGL